MFADIRSLKIHVFANFSSEGVKKKCVHKTSTATFSVSLIFKKYFLQLYCPNGISPIGYSNCLLRRGKPVATESGYPTYGACWVFECFHNPSNSDMDYGIFNARRDVNACDCTRGCTDTVRESALIVDSGGGGNPLQHRGIEPASAA